jgi:putative aminopeptidase FrvX
VQTVIPLLKQLSEAQGITGSEQPVCELLRQTWSPFVDEMHVDKLGSLVALKRAASPGGQPEPLGKLRAGFAAGPRPKLMLAAHMDEIGLRVTGIEQGFLRVTRVGGTDRRVLLGLEVTVHATRASGHARDLPGIVATRPPHVLPREQRKKTVPWDEIFVDVGLPPEEVERLVSVGDLISFRREVAELKNRRLAGKAFDNRACVAIVTLALEQLAEMRHDWDVFAVATVQEEIGLKGAITAAYGVAPDLAVALDVTFGKQPGVSEADTVLLGEGPAIAIGPNFHPGVVARLKEVAEAHEIPYQLEPAPGRSGTDAWAIQVSQEGVPTALISLPLRYMHQPVETLDVLDVERAARLLAIFVAGLEVDFLEKLAVGYTEAPGGRR